MPLYINLFVVRFDDDHRRFLSEAIRAFNSCQNEYRLIARSEDPSLPLENEIEWDAVRTAYRRSRYADEWAIVLTSVPFRDNWFSHCDGKLAVASTHEWFHLYSPPSLQSFLLSEFAIAVACQTTGVSELVLQPHEKSTGCVGDLCAWKPDIVLKLRAGYACPSHRELFQQLGATPAQTDAIETVLNVARAYALGRHEEKRRYGAYTDDRVFIVHGRDVAARLELEALVARLALTPVAIMNEPLEGRTIIEQIEEHAGVGYAFVLFTPDDEGRLRGTDALGRRPRQNVVFEYGLFVGLLGRARVCCIARSGDIELPSDLAGVLQLRYSDSVNELGVRVVDELRRAGYDVTL